MKETFTNAEVKNAKHFATIGGIILGTVITIGVGIVIKKTTDANIIDGSVKLLDKSVNKIKHLSKKKVDAVEDNSTSEEAIVEEE